MKRDAAASPTAPVTVRLPGDVYDRLDRISQRSVRSAVSLSVFALAHFLDLAETDRDGFIAASISGLKPASGDRRLNLATVDKSQQYFMARVTQVALDDYKVTSINARWFRAAILSWLASGSDDDLISQVGAPPAPREAISA